MKTLTVILTTTLITAGIALAEDKKTAEKNDAGGWANDPYALESCINGGVSPTGLYPTEAAELAAFELHAKAQKDTSKK